LLLLTLAGKVARRRWVVAAASLPFLAAPVVFLSRGATVALLVALLVLAVKERLWRRGWKLIATVLVLLIAGVVARVLGLWDRFQSDETLAVFTSGRNELWASTTEIWADNPLFGAGIGAVSDNLWAYFGVAYTHNLPLQVIAQLGLLLGLAYLALVWPYPSRLFSVATPAIVFLIIDSMVEPVVEAPAGAILYAALLSVHLTSAGPKRERGWGLS
jgi:O-antigen ligase